VRLFGLEIRRAPLSPVADNRGGWWPLVREPFTGAWQRNLEWTTDTVLAHHAIYACITRIAQDIGKLRPKLVEQGADGIWKEITNAAHSPVLARPNRFQNHIQFKEWWTISKLVHGNTYALKDRDERRVVKAMYLLDPSRVKVLVAPDGEVFYELGQDNLSELPGSNPIVVPASEIVHDRINCLYHPLVGTSPIFACGTAANMGLQIERNSSGFFGNGSNPSGLLTTPAAIDKVKATELSEIWQAQYGSGQSGRVAVLGGDMKFTPLRMTAVDSQLVEQLGWTAETVCSTFHVPPFKVGVGSQPTYQNGEILNQVYYSDCLQSLIEQWELCMDEAMGLTKPVEGRRLGVELDLDGLLRMDGATQVKTLTEGIKGGLWTPNEARRKVDASPLTGGDTVYMQEQNYSLAALDARDRENPLAPSNQPKPEPPAAPAPDDGRRSG
jgi:HK97 family phage portal protein